MTGIEDWAQGPLEESPKAEPRSRLRLPFEALLISAFITLCWWLALPLASDNIRIGGVIAGLLMTFTGCFYESLLMKYSRASNVFYETTFKAIKQGLRMPGSKRFEHFHALALTLRVLLFSGIGVAVTSYIKHTLPGA